VVIGEPSVATGIIFDDERPSKTSLYFYDLFLLLYVHVSSYCTYVYTGCSDFEYAYDSYVYIHIERILNFIIVIQFLSNTSSADESDGVITFTVISLVPSDKPFSVKVCTREISPQSAEGLLKHLNFYYVAYFCH